MLTTIPLSSQEVVSAPGLKHVEKDEYSESGRGVYPDGLYRVLISFHDRYKKYSLPYIITENGVSDSSDYIRRPYITEHLLAIQAAMKKVSALNPLMMVFWTSRLEISCFGHSMAWCVLADENWYNRMLEQKSNVPWWTLFPFSWTCLGNLVQGVPVQGYCFWTTSDNWEWADGYGPKFGLVAVDRHNDLGRTPRPSYYLFGEVCGLDNWTRCLTQISPCIMKR